MRAIDPKAIDGKFAEIGAHAGLLVIGAGPAGLAAATEAARAGLNVVLADENPLDPALMGMDVPHAFGARMTAAVQNRARMMERITLSDPGIAEAFDAGVDVRLGMTIWGLFPNAVESRALPGLVAGLEEGGRASLMRCDHVIVAAGARDLMLGFEDWDQPGVIGAQALHALLHRYDACAARRILVLGSGAAGLNAALLAAERGLEVAGVVEPRAAPQGPAELVQALAQRGVPLLTGCVIRSASGGADGVQEAVLVQVDDQLAPRAGTERRIVCDTICLAVGFVPNIELLAAAGCAVEFDATRGGWAPVLEGQRTTLPRLQAVGDCAGIDPSRIADPAQARDQAQRAVRAIMEKSDTAAAPRSQPAEAGHWAYAADWMTALTQAGGSGVICCRCESVTRGDITGVRPPAYLNAREGRIARRDLATLLRDGPPNQDQIKRLTRSGMGECQGRRCREQTALLLAASAGVPAGRIPLASYRAPVRPLPLGVLADQDESRAMRQGWDAWFGIPTQWTPWWDIGTERDGVGRDAGLGDETWHL